MKLITIKETKIIRMKKRRKRWNNLKKELLLRRIKKLEKRRKIKRNAEDDPLK